MNIAEDEIRAAIGHPVRIEAGSPHDGVAYADVTAANKLGLWKHDSEEAAKADLLANIAKRAEGYTVIRFRFWPETGSRPDGKCSGYARARFS